MRWKLPTNGLLCTVCIVVPASAFAWTQDSIKPTAHAEVSLRLGLPAHAQSSIPSVVWLEALPGTPQPAFVHHSHYTLLQKNRMFTPHLLVVPVGSVVSFPNADPFFHNVFSLFDGKRFDLGLYEAGSTKELPFTREGVSYIFCNIHPQMSAVVVALSTPLYALADAAGSFIVHDVPSGDYSLHVWAEGVPQATLDRLTHRVHVSSGPADLGELRVPAVPRNADHPNKFGLPYGEEPKRAY